MKKVLALVLSVVMVFAMGMTAFAASPITDPTKMDVSSTVTTGKIELSYADPYYVNSAKELANGLNESSDVLAVVNVDYMIGNQPAHLPAGGANIRLNVPSVKKGDNIVLLHLLNGKWEQIRPYEVGDGYVIGHFSDLSPVAIVKLPGRALSGDATTATGTSPKTGYWE